MVAENAAVLARMRRGGIATVSPLAGLAALNTMLSFCASTPQVCQLLFILPALVAAMQCALSPVSIHRRILHA